MHDKQMETEGNLRAGNSFLVLQKIWSLKRSRRKRQATPRDEENFPRRGDTCRVFLSSSWKHRVDHVTTLVTDTRSRILAIKEKEKRPGLLLFLLREKISREISRQREHPGFALTILFTRWSRENSIKFTRGLASSILQGGPKVRKTFY